MFQFISSTITTTKSLFQFFFFLDWLWIFNKLGWSHIFFFIILLYLNSCSLLLPQLTCSFYNFYMLFFNFSTFFVHLTYINLLFLKYHSPLNMTKLPQTTLTLLFININHLNFKVNFLILNVFLNELLFIKSNRNSYTLWIKPI